jgi:hypothetical protein
MIKNKKTKTTSKNEEETKEEIKKLDEKIKLNLLYNLKNQEYEIIEIESRNFYRKLRTKLLEYLESSKKGLESLIKK